PVSADGKFLHNGVVTFDTRTAPLVEWWEKKLPRQRIFEISGMPLHGMYTASKIVWWQQNRPEVFAKAAKFLCYQDLLIQQLALEHGLHDLAARRRQPQPRDHTLRVRVEVRRPRRREMREDVERGGILRDLG